ncbi:MULTISPECIES: molybdopterin-guanine dinucleotide biosynthesis protein B [Anaeromyxobacter]|uniref:molybdopterin-guanine dinucleotide biosynthesis protein B n=1 Tax=Anaeromyxobacter TaxID=161492 RepID=UPI001F58B6BC|nr:MULTISPECIES: molybdopterin-guanine dinucleotide biosynthesis protein B [unclassified Anaeromyxobacter]
MRRAPLVAVSGASGAGKTRLLSRLIPVLVRRGVRVGVLKHTGHPHPFDVPGKDTDVLRRAGAVAAAIEGPHGLAYFGPPAGGARALARLLPEVDLVLAEGFKREPLPRVEVYRPGVSRALLADADPRVFAIVGTRPTRRRIPALDPDDAEGLADLLCGRFRLLGARAGGPERLRVRPTVSRVSAKGSERTRALGRRERMPKKTTNRKGATARARGSRRSGASRSDAGRKGGNATLRARGPEFYSEIGRKGGKKSRSGARAGRSSSAARTSSKRGTTTKRGAARRGTARRTSRTSRTSRTR